MSSSLFPMAVFDFPLRSQREICRLNEPRLTEEEASFPPLSLSSCLSPPHRPTVVTLLPFRIQSVRCRQLSSAMKTQ